jgi:hypothetical protein
MASPAQANQRDVCPPIPIVAPDTKSREIDLKKYGIKFRIPANYKTRAQMHGGSLHIYISNPSSLEYADCLTKNQIGRDDITYVGVGIQVGDIKSGATLVETARFIQAQSGGRGMSSIRETSIANQSAIEYTIQMMGDDAPVTLVSTPNKKHFVEILPDNSSSRSQELADMIIGSIVFKSAESPNYAEMRERKVNGAVPDKTGAGYVRDKQTGSDEQSPQLFSNKASKPYSRLISNSTIASARPPSTQEISQLIQQSQISKSIAKLSQSQLNDRQKLRSQTNKYLAPFAGAWLTADNQRLFVYPSSRRERQACIIVEKNGTQDLQIGIASGHAIGTDMNIGDIRLFNTKQETLGLRRPGSNQLIAVYPSPNSANLTADHRSAMEGNGCITSFPSTAIATAPTKPAFQTIKTFNSVKAFGLEQMLGSNQALAQVPLDLEKLAQEKYSLPKFPKLDLLSEKLTDVGEQKGKFLGSRKDISFQDYLTLKLKVKAQMKVLMHNIQAVSLTDQYLEHFQKDRQNPHPLVKDVAAQFTQAVGQDSGSQWSFVDRAAYGVEETRVALGKFSQGVFNTTRSVAPAWIEFDSLIKLMPNDSERKKLQLIQELAGDADYLFEVNSQMENILEASKSGNLDKANRELAKLATATLKWLDDREKTGNVKALKRGVEILEIRENAVQLKESVEILQNSEVNSVLSDFDKTYLTTVSLGSALDMVSIVSSAVLPDKSAPSKIVEKAKSVKTVLFDAVKVTYQDSVRREYTIMSAQFGGNQKKIQGLSAAFDFSGEKIGNYLLKNRSDVLRQSQNGSVEVGIKETVYPRN